MIRAAIYARYSSDQQRDASIEDQIRLCTERAECEGWKVINCYTDHAVSGASLMRPGIQQLMQDGASGKFDIVVAEALDRLSRDQEDIAGLFKRLQFADVGILTLSEGEVSSLHIGLKGTMNALFLKDLADKTRRGLRGRVEQGKSGGGNSYGYQVVKQFDGNGEAIRGDRAIDEAEAATVKRVFADYLKGQSPKAIAHALNKEGIAGPAGRAWGPSTIYGNWRRGTGILNNELYVGRLVWNKLRYMKDPDTGKRVSRINPEEEWIINEVPELRIVDQELWDDVKAKQLALRRTYKNFRDMKRPQNLLSNLMKCGCCGGGYSKISQTHIGCSASRNKGLSVCDNRRAMKQETVERIVISLLSNELMNPKLLDEFCQEYTRHINKLRIERNASISSYKAALAKLERDEAKMIQAIIDGYANDELKVKLNSVDGKKAELRALLEDREEAPALLHPAMANRYRDEVKALTTSLKTDDNRYEAAELMRSLIDRIVLTPDPKGKGLLIDLYGDLPGILNISRGQKMPVPECSEQDIKMIRLVAGLENGATLQGGNALYQSATADHSFVSSNGCGSTQHFQLTEPNSNQQVQAVVSPRNQKLPCPTRRHG